MSTLRVATAAYDIGEFQSWDQYASKVERWIRDAAAHQAQLLLFPEYASLELASLFQANTGADLAAQLRELQLYLARFIDLHRTLATTHRVTVAAASFPVRIDGGAYHNRVHVFSPNGAIGTQDKLHMTRFESERWGISAASDTAVFDSALGHFAVAICYDAEFSTQARRQVDNGANILLVPSCTDTLAGYHRVRIGAQARALENQCYVVQATTVGNAAWSEAVDVNIGAAGVFAPPDRGFPDDGVIALGPLNAPGWVYADLDLVKLRDVRREGQVLNLRDQEHETRVAAGAVQRVTL